MDFNICQINEPADQIMFPDTTISHINIVTAAINPLTTVLTHSPQSASKQNAENTAENIRSNAVTLRITLLK